MIASATTMPMRRVSISSERNSEQRFRSCCGGFAPSASRANVAWVIETLAGSGGHWPPDWLRADGDAAGWYALAQGGFAYPARVKNEVEVAHVDGLRREQDGVQGVVPGGLERFGPGDLVEGCPSAQLDR